METNKKTEEIKLPCGQFCGYNCADGCIYWSPKDFNEKGEQYCSNFGEYFFPRDRNGCLRFKRLLNER